MDLGIILNDSATSTGIEGGGQNTPPGGEGSFLGHNPNSYQEQESNYGSNNQTNNMQDNMAAQQHTTQTQNV